MCILKKNVLPMILVLYPYGLYAWGDAHKLSNGSCRYEKETGFSGVSIYTKSNKAFVISDVTDIRYGTISTVYNAKTCKKVTSGNKSDSKYEALMKQRGFQKLKVTGKDNLDDSFLNKILFVENSDSVKVKIEPIDLSVAQELKNILISLSDKQKSSSIRISSSTKKLLGYDAIYTRLINRINNLSKSDINYDYVFSLTKIMKHNGVDTEAFEKIAVAKQNAWRQEMARIEEEKIRRQQKSSEDISVQNANLVGKAIVLALIVKGAQKVSQWWSKAKSTSSSSGTTYHEGNRHIVDMGRDVSSSEWSDDTIMYKTYVTISDGSHIDIKLEKDSGCHDLSLYGDIHGSCTSCFDSLNNVNWVCHAGGNEFSLYASNPIEAANAIIQHAR